MSTITNLFQENKTIFHAEYLGNFAMPPTEGH